MLLPYGDANLLGRNEAYCLRYSPWNTGRYTEAIPKLRYSTRGDKNA